MASVRIIPVVLLLTIIAVQSLHVDEIYKNSISLNGFKETDVLKVYYGIYETKNTSAGIERELIIKSYSFNDIPCQPNVGSRHLGNHSLGIDRFLGMGLVKFSKNQPLVGEQEAEYPLVRFNGWAANRSHIEVTEDTKKIPHYGT